MPSMNGAMLDMETTGSRRVRHARRTIGVSAAIAALLGGGGGGFALIRGEAAAVRAEKKAEAAAALAEHVRSQDAQLEELRRQSAETAKALSAMAADVAVIRDRVMERRGR